MLKRLIQLIFRPRTKFTKEEIRAAVEKKIKSIPEYGTEFTLAGRIVIEDG